MITNKINFGGKNLQNLTFDGGKSEFYYFHAGSDHEWFNISNWYKNDTFTIPAGKLPGPDDIVVIVNEDVDTAYSKTIEIGFLSVHRTITWNYSYYSPYNWSNPGNVTLGAGLNINAQYGVSLVNDQFSFYGSINNYATITSPSISLTKISNFGILNGNASLYNDYNFWGWDGSPGQNYGTINGSANFYQNCINYGTVEGLAVFYDSSNNSNSIIGNAIFNNSSQNSGTITGDVILNDSSTNYGTINGDVILNNDVRNDGLINGNVVFNNNSYNTSFGTINGNVIFNDGSYLGWGSINGDVVFNHYSYNDSYIGGNVIFNDYSYNNGTIDGNAIFNNSSINYYVVNGNSIFNDNSINYYWTNVYGLATFNNNSFNLGSVNSAIFNDYSNNNNGYINNDATFNDGSTNNGTVNGNATFNDNSSNNGTVNGIVTCNTTGTCIDTNPVTGNETSLLLHFDGSFSDSSSNNLVPLWTGNTNISSSQSKFGGNSAYFSGNETGINYGTDTKFAMGNGDFTAEAWIYYQGQNSNFSGSQIMGCHQAGIGASWLLAIESTGEVWAHINGTTLASAYYVPQNTWTHVAMVRYNGILYLYINGISTGSPQSTPGNIGIPYPFVIGTDCCSDYRFIGYMDDIRVTKGIAVYTSNFTPPSLPFGIEVSLLNNFDTNSNITLNGNATINSGMLCTNNNGWATYNSGNIVPSGTEDFTIEMIIRFNTSPAWMIVFAPNTRIYKALQIGFSDNNTLLVGPLDSGWEMQPSVTMTQDNNWHHLAVCRSGGTLRAYQDGILVGQVSSNTSYTSIEGVSLGGMLWGSPQSIDGCIDGIRVIKGYAAYTSNFTPPTLPFGANISLLMNFDGTNGSSSITDSSDNNRTVVTSGNVQISTSQVKSGSGSCYFPADLNSSSSNYLTVNNISLLSDFTIEFWFYPTTFSNGGGNGGYQCLFAGGADFTYGIMMNNTGYLAMWASSNSSSWDLVDNSFSSSPVVLNQWNHISFVREGSIFRLFVNGNGTSVQTNNTNPMSGSSFRVGIWGNGYSPINDGYIDELYIVNGAALHSSNFTPAGISPSTILSMSMSNNSISDESSLNNSIYNNSVAATPPTRSA